MLKGASYFPFTEDSLIDYNFYCKYTDKDWEKTVKGYRNDFTHLFKYTTFVVFHQFLNIR